MPVLVERIAKCPATTENDDVCDGVWRVLENGVLAVSTPIEVETAHGRRRVWCDPRGWPSGLYPLAESGKGYKGCP